MIGYSVVFVCVSKVYTPRMKLHGMRARILRMEAKRGTRDIYAAHPGTPESDSHSVINIIATV